MNWYSSINYTEALCVLTFRSSLVSVHQTSMRLLLSLQQSDLNSSFCEAEHFCKGELNKLSSLTNSCRERENKDDLRKWRRKIWSVRWNSLILYWLWRMHAMFYLSGFHIVSQDTSLTCLLWQIPIFFFQLLLSLCVDTVDKQPCNWSAKLN